MEALNLEGTTGYMQISGPTVSSFHLSSHRLYICAAYVDSPDLVKAVISTARFGLIAHDHLLVIRSFIVANISFFMPSKP